MEKTKNSFRNVVIGVIGVAGVAIIGGIVLYLFLPAQYLTMDVNPSMELQTNRLNRVVSLVGRNEDARLLLADYEPEGQKLDVVLEQVVKRMVESGYISENQMNDILLTSEKDSESRKMLSNAGRKVQKELDKHNLSGEIVMQSMNANEAIKKTAMQHQVSAGKMAIIDQFLGQDASLSAEVLAGTSISDLLLYAEKNNISLHELENHLEMLQANGGSDVHLEELEEAVDDKKDSIKDPIEEAADKKADEEDQIRDVAEQEAEQAEEEAEEARDVAEEEQEAQEIEQEEVEQEEIE